MYLSGNRRAAPRCLEAPPGARSLKGGDRGGGYDSEGLDALDHFFGKGQVGLGALGAAVEDDAGDAVAGGFGKAHVARHDSFENLVTEVGFELGGNLLLEGDARVEHDPQETDDGKVAVEVGVHLLDRVDQVGLPARSTRTASG